MTETLSAEEEALLVAEMRAGSTRARDRLVASCEGIVRHWAARYAGLVSAEDLEQEGRLAAASVVGAFDPARSRLTTYAWQRVRHAIKDAAMRHAEHERFIRSLPDGGTAPSPHDALEHRDTYAANLATVSPAERAILELRHVGYDFRELAGMLGMSVTAAKVAAHRALKKIRGCNESKKDADDMDNAGVRPCVYRR
jgi:RNA polymerase sigma factor (sigma-70 family)